ncbi:MAG TPA: ATP-binding protein [Clostridia bacterium]|nr:ATP-binding protein [Clostridia bacterium]
MQNAVLFIGDLEIPIIVIREVIANALIYRNYAIIGSEIKIAVYESRIEIISLSDLPKTNTVEDILSGLGRSETRNKVIARIIKECGLMDQWGSGINRMINLCNEAGLKDPIVKEEGIFVWVTFFRHASKEPKQIKVGRSITVNKSTVGSKSIAGRKLVAGSKPTADSRSIEEIKLKKKDLTKNEKELIEIILINNQKATVKDISEQLDISIASVKRRINKM